MPARKAAVGTTAAITISAPNMQFLEVGIIGTEPLVVNRFSQKMVDMLHAKHEAGSTTNKGKQRAPKDFEALFQGARYRAAEGWDGVNAASFRNAMIRACSLVGYKMTLAKLCLFIVAEGYDREDATPLCRIIGPEPENWQVISRNADGSPDIHPRPLWRKWAIRLRIKYDADQFTRNDVVNLLNRVGQQVGIGEGRPNSKNSNGMGIGVFRLAEDDEPLDGEKKTSLRIVRRGTGRRGKGNKQPTVIREVKKAA
jgi:hypothetical protein